MGWTEAAHPRAGAGSATGGQFIAYDSSKKTGTGYGKKGGDSRVKRLQDALNALGYTDSKGRALERDGMLGPLTTSSVKKAQAKLGLKPDGKVTPALLKRLEGLASAKKKGGSASKTADAFIRRSAAKKSTRHTAARAPKPAAKTPATQKAGTAKPPAKTPARPKPAATQIQTSGPRASRRS